MKRRDVFTFLATLTVLPTLAARTAAQIQVYKDPTCGCCNGWVEHLKSSGFTVAVTDVADTGKERKRLGMPEQFAGCHTAAIDGYVVEGHVPAADIRRLLAKRPAAIGLSVRGMPVGSPGMEVGDKVEPYDVLLVGRSGGATVFARYPSS